MSAKTCILCGYPIGLGRPFTEGTGVNRGVFKHVTCQSAKTGAEIERAAVVAHLRKEADLALSAFTNKRMGLRVNKFVHALADEIEFGKHVSTQRQSEGKP